MSKENKKNTARRQRAIRYIEECKKIHQQWIEYDVEVKIAGDKEWHKKWVRKYNVVLSELKK